MGRCIARSSVWRSKSSLQGNQAIHTLERNTATNAQMLLSYRGEPCFWRLQLGSIPELEGELLRLPFFLVIEHGATTPKGFEPLRARQSPPRSMCLPTAPASSFLVLPLYLPHSFMLFPHPCRRRSIPPHRLPPTFHPHRGVVVVHHIVLRWFPHHFFVVCFFSGLLRTLLALAHPLLLLSCLPSFKVPTSHCCLSVGRVPFSSPTRISLALSLSLPLSHSRSLSHSLSIYLFQPPA